MNIIYMHTHDTGRWIEPYGYPVSTPNLRKLAEGGVLFRQAYSGGPTCSPSRAALLTGMCAHSAGMTGLAHRGFSLNDYDRHLARYLGRNGFETVLCGIQHEAADYRTLGYSRVLGSPHDDMASTRFDSEAWDLANAEAVVGYLKDKPKKPFFLSFGMFNTHREFPPVDPSIHPNFVRPPYPLADTPENRNDFAGYMTSVGIVDHCAGQVMEALAQSDMLDDTILIFTTDHGLAFPHMKCNLTDAGIGVSFIMKAPGARLNGDVSDALVSQLDLFPTLCDLLGLEKPEWLQGRTLLPILDKKETEVRSHLFAEVTYHAAYEPMRCIRSKRYSYIRLFDDHEGYVPANIDDCDAKTFLLDSGMLNDRRAREQLYDLHLDPVERVNRADDPAYAEARAELAERLESWMRETSDPLLHGKVEKPAGAVANKLSCISPGIADFE
jgi:arylsulfatase A-like enzyme